LAGASISPSLELSRCSHRRSERSRQPKGVLLVPSFAIGRTQEVVWYLNRLLRDRRIPAIPVYLDSPMASAATAIYRRHAEYFDDATRRVLDQEGAPLDYPGQIIANNVHDSELIQVSPRPHVIVASNGMLTGGRVVGHLRNLFDDPGAVILFVGYQGEGTLGAHLEAGARSVVIDGQPREVWLGVRSIDGFSAHADESELLDWIAGFVRGKQPGESGFPRTVFLVHGDPNAQRAIEPKIRALGPRVHVPVWHEEVELDGT